MGADHTSYVDPLIAQHARLWAQLDRLLLRRADLRRRSRRSEAQEQEMARIEATVDELRRQSHRISEVLRAEAWALE